MLLSAAIVEFDIRDVKVTMDTENIRVKSVCMVQKELMTSVVAYNLTAQFRRQAAKVASVEPRRLSFSGVWTSFREILLYGQSTTFDESRSSMSRFTASSYRRITVYVPTPQEQPSDEGLFGPRDIIEDAARGMVTCPAGQTSNERFYDKQKQAVRYRFAATTGQQCPLADRCMKKAAVCHGRTVTKSDYQAEHERARKKTQTPEYHAVRREHPKVERTGIAKHNPAINVVHFDAKG